MFFGVSATVARTTLLFGVLAAVKGLAVFFDKLVKDEDSVLVFREMAVSDVPAAVLGVLATEESPDLLNGYSTSLTEC